MCVSQHEQCSPALPLLLLLPLTFLSSTPPLAQAALHIPSKYKLPNISQPPTLTDQPSSFTAFVPDDIYLPCEASGDPTPTVRWVKDGEEFGPERHGSNTLRHEDEEPLRLYGGQYRCYASNTLGTAVTPTVKVIVEAAPVLLIQQKVRKRAYQGHSLILVCNPPESSTTVTNHWMDKKMFHITQSDRVMVGMDGNLYFSNLKRRDTRDDYICTAQYTAARTIFPWITISLTVMSNPPDGPGIKPGLLRPTGLRSSVLGLRGSELTLECIPSGLPTPTVEWKKSNSHLNETSGKLQKYNRWLRFDSITLEDEGEYECRAQNRHGVVRHSFTVTVEAAPSWVKQPQNLLYAPGETVRLDCQAEGVPTPSVTWSINGQPITGESAPPRLSVSGGVLTLRDVELADSAVFQCEASNKHGSLLLNVQVHVVELPPQILSSDGEAFRVTEGGNVTLDCQHFGSPPPNITWEAEDKPLLASDPRVSLLSDGTMTLSDVSHDDAGSYTCSVKHTNISISAHLEVFNRSVILTGPQDLWTLRGGSALLDCLFYKDPRLDQHKIIWSRDGKILQESSPDDKHTFFENGTLQVTDIQSDAVYSCEVVTQLDRVKATGSITVAAPPDPPRDLSLSDVKERSLTLSWIPGLSHNSPVTEFIVEAREEQHTEESRWRWEEWMNVPGDVNHLQLTLSPFCTYRFRVVAVNKLGLSEPSEPSERHSTPPAVPDRNPTGVRSESTDPQTLVITWKEMDERFHNGPGFLYKVSWREAGNPNAPWNQANVRSPPVFVNNTGPYTPFEIKVQAANSLGEGPGSLPVIGHSGEDYPEEAPTDISVNLIKTTARVKWTKAQNVRGVLLGYKIYIRGGREKDRESWVQVTVDGMKTSGEVTGLQLYSRYELFVTAFNSRGESPRSTRVHFATPEGAPGPVASLKLESPTESSLVLRWTPPVETNGLLLGYWVLYQRDTGGSPLHTVTITDPSVTHVKLDHLDPGSRYILKVTARTAMGDGPPVMLRAPLLGGVPPSNITVVPSDTSVTLSWAPSERERNLGFHVHYLRRSAAGGEWEESEVLNSTQGFYSLTGLQPGTEYHLQIIHENTTHWESVIHTTGSAASEMPGGFVAALIRVIVIIMLLVGSILLIFCCMKRRKYSEVNKEDEELELANAR